MRRSSGRAARCAGVRRSPHSALQSTNGARARSAPRKAAGSATRPAVPATTARVAPARGQPVDLALGDAAEGHARVVEPGGRVMRAPAEERQLERHALVQRAERAGAIGRDVVGDEEDRPGAHRSASS